MSENFKLPEREKVLLLCQEKILDLYGEPRQRARTRLRQAAKIFFMTLLAAFLIICTVFVTGVLVTGSVEDVRAAIAEGVIDRIFGVEQDKETQRETSAHENEPESEPESELESESEADTPATESDVPESKPDADEPLTLEALYSFDFSKVPEDELAVIPMDLSLYASGVTYINNSTGYALNAEALLERELGGAGGFELLGGTDAPTVLIIHTHATEAYLDDGTISYRDDGGELARSSDKTENVISVGALIAQILNEKGINTVHCTFMHDSVGYRNSYARAAETIKDYLETYPSIKFVIDIHRDGVMRSTGELVRPVTLVNGEAAAQVMCVVGSDYGGEACPNWQDNLSLALKLRNELNGEYKNLCRPTDLRCATYNQEFSKYSLLLEIGSCANSIEEAQRTAELVATALAKIIKKI